MDLDLPASPETPPPDSDRSVAVVGGGAVGATAARDLARWDVDVTLFERDAVGAGATGRAAGIVYDAFAEDLDAAVADRALDRFRELSGTAEFELTDRPYVWFAREGDDRNAEAIREQVPRMRANGRDVDLLAPGEIADRWPTLCADDISVAAVAESSGTTTPSTYAAATAELAEADGATIETGTAARIETDPVAVRVGAERRQFDAVLVAAGARTPGLLADPGIELASEAYRVQALTVGVEAEDDEQRDRAAALPSFYDATGGYYARPKDGELLAGDGTEPVPADPDDWDRESDAWFRDDVLEKLSGRVDGVESTASDAWAGLCTATPDRNPLVGQVESGLFVATGFHGHGFMRAPAIGELVARQLCGADGIAAFDPARFDGRDEFEIVEGMALDEH
ncbi:FAD-dependent oxidoreductase [Natronoarchaeum mannanilyticum]